MEQTIKWFSADELPKKGGRYLISGRMVVNHHIENVVVSCYLLSRAVEEQKRVLNKIIEEDMTIEYWAEFPKSPLVSTSDNDLGAVE